MLKRFLTVSALLSAMAASADTKWVNIATNGDAEGEYGDVACAWGKEDQGEPHAAAIEAVDGSNAFVVHATAKAENPWDNQFWICAPEKYNEGDVLKVSFRYKAAKEASIGTQAHCEPSNYNHWACIGNINFTTEWQEFSAEITLSADMAGNGKGFQSIAFNLNDFEEANDYYIDDIKIEVEKEVADEPIEPTAPTELVNGDFAEGEGGWAQEATGGAWSFKTDCSPAVVEAYAGWGNLDLTDYSLSQKLHLEAGTYKLSAYGFYRYGVSYDVDPSKSSAKLYAGDASVELATLGGIELEAYANSMDEASAAFAAGNYLNTLEFTLEEAADIEVGIAGVHELKQSWIIAGPMTLEKVAGGEIDIPEVEGQDVMWSNTGDVMVEWSGTYRFCDAAHASGEEIQILTDEQWAAIKTGTFYLDFKKADGADWQNIRVTTGWWTSNWPDENGINLDSEHVTDNGDGTYTLEINFDGSAILDELDEKHLLFTGYGYVPLKLYTAANAAPEVSEVDITTLEWVNEGWDCVVDYDNANAATVFGTDAGPSEDGKLSYVDATAYSQIIIYGEAGQTARVFVNRAEMNNDLSVSQFMVVIGEDGKGVLDFADIYAAQPGAEYIHINGVKARSWDTTLNVSKIVLVKSGESTDTPDVPEVKPAEIAEGDYYLLNLGAGQFLQGANDWGTRASLKEAGQLVTLEAYGSGYSINTHIHNNDVQHYLGTNLYVDADQKAHEFYEVSQGIYVIKNEEGNYLYADENGFVQSAAEIDENEANAQWVLVTREDIKEDMLVATKKNPYDISSLIYDNNFGRNNRDIEKWQGDQPSKGGDNANFNAEKWGGNSQEFDSYQVLTDMPNGVYRLSAQGYYRYNNTEENTNDVAVAAHEDGSEVINSFLYANEVAVPLKSIADDEAAEALESLPFSQAAASAAFGQGLYQNELTVVVEDNTLRIGVKKTAHMGCDWTVWDNFKLEYLGQAPVTTVADGDYYLYNVGAGQFLQGANSWGTRASIATSGQLVTLAANGEGYTIDTHITNGGDSHYLGTNLYVDAAADVHTLYDAGDGHYLIANSEGKYLYTDESTEIQASENGDSEGDNAHWMLISREEVLASMANATEDKPIEVSHLIYDANFGRNNTYIDMWEGDKPGKNGANDNMNAEKWGGNSQEFDSHQTINVPNGIYKLSAQGYYRYNNTEDNTNDVAIAAHADGSEVINSFLYANDVEVALKSIADDEAAEALESLPFSQGAASAAFDMGLYKNELTVVVTDGTLTFGVKKTSHPGCDWTVWDNFQLTYYGAAEAEIAEGDYYLYNVGAGQYLQGANSWGTRSSLSASGQLVTLAAKDGGYTIDTHITNGNDSHYLGTNLYVDAGAAVHKFYDLGDGKLLLKNSDNNYLYATDGTNEIQGAADANLASDKAMWMLLKAEDIVANMEGADKENIADVTSLIPDANFGRNNTLINQWEGDVPAKGGANENMNAEKWGGNSQEFDSYVTLNVPNGTYRLSAQGYYRYNNTTDNTNNIAASAHADGTEEINSYLYANEVAVPLKSIADEEAVEVNGKMPFSQSEASEAFAKGLYNNELIVKVTDGVLKLGVKKTSHPGCDWTVWDNFSLQYIGVTKPGYEYEPIVISGDFAKSDGTWCADVDGYTYFTYTAPKTGIVDFTAYGPALTLETKDTYAGWVEAEYTDDVCVKSQGVPAMAGEEVVVRAKVAASDFQLIAVNVLTAGTENAPIELVNNDYDPIKMQYATADAEGYYYFSYEADEAGDYLIMFNGMTVEGCSAEKVVEENATYIKLSCEEGKPVVFKAQLKPSTEEGWNAYDLYYWIIPAYDEEEEGDETGIASVGAEGNAAIYDIAGRRVSKAVKGNVYIVNGKKVIK